MNAFPFVTCLCLTTGARAARWLPQAIDSFRRQNYSGRMEMLIVADGPPVREDRESSDLGFIFQNTEQNDPSRSLRLIHYDARLIGEKRNAGCAAARGEVIVHFDDDDWSAEGRVLDQVTLLQRTGKAVAAFHSLPFENLLDSKIMAESGRWRPASHWWAWKSAGHSIAGTSLCYRKDWWSGHPFPAVERGEDDAFWAEALAESVAISAEGWGLPYAYALLIARNHTGNTSQRAMVGPEWTELPDPRGATVNGHNFHNEQ